MKQPFKINVLNRSLTHFSQQFFSSMEVLSSSSSSSSFAANITPQIMYDVFLSFRGEDTRYNFTSHLHKALCVKNIETFIDYKLNRGDEISPSLLQAIEGSQLSVVIFSENYASSRWCLEELVKILECNKKYKQIVIPVFYEVDPSDVKNQEGSFADAFANHKQRFKDSLDKVQTWKDALKEAADLPGHDSRVIKLEAVLLENIVKDVMKKLKDISSSDNDNLIGMDSRINEIEAFLDIGSKDVRIVGIWGINGIGKTTLAGEVFNKISCKFEGTYFAHNVGEASTQSGGLNNLRRELISATLGDESGNIGSSIRGLTLIRKRLERMKLLMVFDNVTGFGQIEFLIGGFDRLCLESRIIITSTDKEVLEKCRVNQIYKVEELLFADALQLFCLHAFGRNQPPVDYEELSNTLVNSVGGVPSALKFLGCSLFGKTEEVWESEINKLEKRKKLKIGLQD